MAEDANASQTPWRRRLSLEEWWQATLEQLEDTRRMVEHWLVELEHWLEQLNRRREGATASELDELEQGVCECTRMLIVGGETLHNYASIFVTWSGKPAPDAAWQPDLAARTDDLLERAADETQIAAYNGNCAQRLGYLRERWQEWCPAFQPDPANVG